jgi:hypothetical protein
MIVLDVEINSLSNEGSLAVGRRPKTQQCHISGMLGISDIAREMPYLSWQMWHLSYLHLPLRLLFSKFYLKSQGRCRIIQLSRTLAATRIHSYTHPRPTKRGISRRYFWFTSCSMKMHLTLGSRLDFWKIYFQREILIREMAKKMLFILIGWIHGDPSTFWKSFFFDFFSVETSGML